MAWMGCSLMYVCLCKGITENQIRDAVDQGAESLRAVRDTLGVSTQCGKCSCLAREVVRDALETPSSGVKMFGAVA